MPAIKTTKQQFQANIIIVVFVVIVVSSGGRYCSSLPHKAVFVLGLPSLHTPSVVTSSPGDGPVLCHVVTPPQKWQYEVPLTQ
ncbi:hypothetical protein TgHK011_006678 [Trichoderma gracile]|nr:hypothetical protein TgHK011_006678 [Trichoderma gracile]